MSDNSKVGVNGSAADRASEEKPSSAVEDTTLSSVLPVLVESLPRLRRLDDLTVDAIASRVVELLVGRLNLARLRPSKKDKAEQLKFRKVRKDLIKIQESGPGIAVPQHTSSPFGLFQETIGSPWHLLVACTLLNRTRGSTVEPIFDALIRTWNTPEDLVQRDGAEKQMINLFSTIGFQNQRASTLLRLAREWIALDTSEFEGGVPTFEQVAFLHGIGTYALDSYRIFVHPREVRPCDPLSGDPRLFSFCQWIRDGMPKLSWAQQMSVSGSGL